MAAIIQQVLILFLMAAAGYLMVRLKKWNDDSLQVLTGLMVCIGNPCLNLSKLDQIARGELKLDWLIVFLFTIVMLAVLIGLFFFVFRRSPHDRRAVYIQMAVMSNCGFMGYPMIEAALGAQAVAYGVAFVTAFNFVSWTLGLMLFYKEWRVGLKKMFNINMAAIALGLLLHLTGLTLPAALSGAISAMGSLATPVSMLIAGAYLGGVTRALFRDRCFLLSCGLRLLVCPLIVLGMLALCGMQGDMRGAIYVVSTMPASANMVLQASAYSTPDAQRLAVGGVALTTVLSIATIPLMLMLL